MDVKGSKTEQNLRAAFGGESMARNKYTYFAEVARKEEHPEIAELFENMAKNESIHGKLLYKALYGKMGDSATNLKDAIEGEYGEWSSMYPEFAKTAEAEGFNEIAEVFRRISAIEKDHEFRFLKALTQLLSGKKAQPEPADTAHSITVQGYRCMFCGAIYEKREDVCSLCGAIGSFEPTQIEKKLN